MKRKRNHHNRDPLKRKQRFIAVFYDGKLTAAAAVITVETECHHSDEPTYERIKNELTKNER